MSGVATSETADLDKPLCRVQYERKGGRGPGDRIVECGREPHPGGGSHRDNATGFRWNTPMTPPREPRKPLTRRQVVEALASTVEIRAGARGESVTLLVGGRAFREVL